MFTKAGIPVQIFIVVFVVVVVEARPIEGLLGDGGGGNYRDRIVVEVALELSTPTDLGTTTTVSSSR